MQREKNNRLGQVFIKKDMDAKVDTCGGSGVCVLFGIAGKYCYTFGIFYSVLKTRNK